MVCAYFKCKRQLNLIGCLIFAWKRSMRFVYRQANECFKEITRAHQLCHIYAELQRGISATTSLTVMYVHCTISHHTFVDSRYSDYDSYYFAYFISKRRIMRSEWVFRLKYTPWTLNLCHAISNSVNINRHFFLPFLTCALIDCVY